MRRQRSTKLVVAFLLAFFASMPVLASTISWFCDGRVCGISLCCCDSSNLEKADPNCQLPEAPSKEQSLCAAGCGCTAVVTTADHATATLMPVSDLPTPGVFVLAPMPVVALIPDFVPLARPLLPDYRGPPTVRLALFPSGLRAPPAS